MPVVAVLGRYLQYIRTLFFGYDRSRTVRGLPVPVCTVQYVLYERAKFFDRGFFLRRDPQLSFHVNSFIAVGPKATEATRPLESSEKMSDKVKEKVRRAYVLMTNAAPGMWNVPQALS